MGPVMICYCIFSARTYTKVTTSNLGEGQQKGREKAQTGKTRQRTDRPWGRRRHDERWQISQADAIAHEGITKRQTKVAQITLSIQVTAAKETREERWWRECERRRNKLIEPGASWIGDMRSNPFELTSSCKATVDARVRFHRMWYLRRNLVWTLDSPDKNDLEQAEL